ncbi:membrane-associated guanylate kinase, WW and PDZ domain-containing protein 1-like isoform X3 [Branchiostoma floridae]|uniref:Membrane-associated guanylate kinase, WW and PDZ domain-containing protein 1-like isoform X3 n=1 Tax=Branchiostoma floridae TaxID=7739 RepID=A0A9J7L8N0_BRAFL|nr:membrane-associated guanylate kinase, WW and PDZ domain-containing protein 1-like isoform X3 [Branchiostoma floridae]
MEPLCLPAFVFDPLQTGELGKLECLRRSPSPCAQRIRRRRLRNYDLHRFNSAGFPSRSHTVCFWELEYFLEIHHHRGQGLTKDLRQYLNTRFQKGSVDHDLQQTIRDNVYLRTVPCTTRGPREGEVQGVDYQFLTVEEFMALEKSGNLLESGLYDGNHYGTPKPPKEASAGLKKSSSTGDLRPGSHPSSEGKRKRNQSNVESPKSTINGRAGDEKEVVERKRSDSITMATEQQDLGPLPDNWEVAYTDNNEMYFIDHNTGTTHWDDPRLQEGGQDGGQQNVPNQGEDAEDELLPYGWERIDDPHYGTYYVDHVNRRTQYEKPTMDADKIPKDDSSTHPASESERTSPPPDNGKDPDDSENSPRDDQSDKAPPSAGGSETGPPPPAEAENASKAYFTSNPDELMGEMIETLLVKSERGFGFTIVGGDEPGEFLQVKSVVPGSPAAEDGKLETGDVIVFVNDTCVLGYTHSDVVGLFQTIPPGQRVRLECRRGYPLPFDPDDPNTNVVTSVAIAMPTTSTVDSLVSRYNGDQPDRLPFTPPQRPTQPLHTVQSSFSKSMPDISARPRHQHERSLTPEPGPHPNRASTGYFYEDGVSLRPEELKPEYVTVHIVKGDRGFGFTIADSAYGQRVKQILDEPRCKNLCVGDVLVEINGTDVRQCTHNELVGILKECTKGKETTIIVQRGGILQLQGKGKKGTPSKQPILPMAQDGLLGRRAADYGYQGPPSHLRAADLAENGRQDTHPVSSYGTLPRAPPRPAEPTMYNGYQYNPPNRSPSRPNYEAPPPPVRMDSEVPSPPVRMDQPPSADEAWQEMTIFLRRQESGFGFRILGGQEEGKPVSIGAIVPGGAADLDGRLLSGDELLYVDGVAVQNASHHKVVSLMGQAALAGKVSLGVRRRLQDMVSQPPVRPAMVNDFRPAPPVVSPVVTYPYDVTVHRNETEGFGFVITSSAAKSGAKIGRIIPSSPAERCGQLAVGDHLVAVNGISILNLSHSEIVNIIKESGLRVTLKISPPDDPGTPGAAPTNNGSMMNAVATPAIADQTNDSFGEGQKESRTREEILEWHRKEMQKREDLIRRQQSTPTLPPQAQHSPYQQPQQHSPGLPPPQRHSPGLPPPQHHSPSQPSYPPHQPLSVQTHYPPPPTSQMQHPPSPRRVGPPSSPGRRSQDSTGKEEYHMVSVQRGVRGFGFSIRGGKEFTMPLFVLRIADDGPAAREGRLRVGDQIMEINGRNTNGILHADAIEMIKSGGSVVRLFVKRGGKVPNLDVPPVPSPVGQQPPTPPIRMSSGITANGPLPKQSANSPHGSAYSWDGHNPPYQPNTYSRPSPSTMGRQPSSNYMDPRSVNYDRMGRHPSTSYMDPTSRPGPPEYTRPPASQPDPRAMNYADMRYTQGYGQPYVVDSPGRRDYADPPVRQPPQNYVDSMGRPHPRY